MTKIKISLFFAAWLFLLACGSKKEEKKEETPPASDSTLSANEEIPVSEPVEYVSEGGRYKINFKSKPDDEETKPIQTAVGPINMYITMLDQGTMVYMTAYIDYPADKLRGANRKELLEGSKSGIIKNFKVTITDEKWSKFQSFDAVDFTATGPQYSTSYKMVFADNRLYQIGILNTGGPVSQVETDNFIGTFEILTDKPVQ